MRKIELQHSTKLKEEAQRRERATTSRRTLSSRMRWGNNFLNDVYKFRSWNGRSNVDVVPLCVACMHKCGLHFATHRNGIVCDLHYIDLTLAARCDVIWACHCLLLASLPSFFFATPPLRFARLPLSCFWTATLNSWHSIFFSSFLFFFSFLHAVYHDLFELVVSLFSLLEISTKQK